MVVKLNRETKLQYFSNLETSKNSKPFRDKCRPYFSSRHTHSDSKIILIEKEEITTNTNEIVEKETLLLHNDELVKTFNEHLAETVEKLNTFTAKNIVSSPDFLVWKFCGKAQFP